MVAEAYVAAVGVALEELHLVGRRWYTVQVGTGASGSRWAWYQAASEARSNSS